MTAPKKQRIVVGLSGGVDSAVTAKILCDQGHDVLGIFLKNWDEDDPECPAARDALDARNVAETLKIPFYTFDFAKEYREDVFAKFLEEHRRGRTPNPDIWCNQYIKFKVFLDKAEELGADLLATGHYARKSWNEGTKKWELQCPQDHNKDQTYFLYTLQQDQLAKSLFPLENMTKDEVRNIARKAGFKNAEKKDSTGICFVGERNYRTFLETFLPRNPGTIIDADTRKILGEHVGLTFYTYGQRKDLHIGGVKGFDEKPFFVVGKNFDTNELVVSQNEDKLLTQTLAASHLRWVSGDAPEKSFPAEAKIRYRTEAVPCEVSLSKDQQALSVKFKNPVRAVTPGQALVLYQDEVCLGGGEID